MCNISRFQVCDAKRLLSSISATVGRLKNQIKTSLKGKLFDYLYRVQGPLEPPDMPLAGGHLFSEEGR
jgi:hypothetical protein